MCYFVFLSLMFLLRLICQKKRVTNKLLIIIDHVQLIIRWRGVITKHEY